MDVDKRLATQLALPQRRAGLGGLGVRATKPLSLMRQAQGPRVALTSRIGPCRTSRPLALGLGSHRSR